MLAAAGVMVHTASGAAGESGFALLKIGLPARGVAVADALTASAGGAAATMYNPAGLLRPMNASAELMVTHREWVQDTRMEHLAAGVRLGETDAIGLSLQSVTVGNIEIRTRPGPAEGTFTARMFSLGVSYAHTVMPGLTAGVTAKMLYQKILVDDAAGYAADLGVQYVPGPEGLTLGFALANLGTGGALREERTPLPALARIGGAYAFQPAEEAAVTLLGDVMHVFPDKQTFAAAGAEIRFRELVTVRGGYQFGSEGRGFSSGLGITYGILALDYAFAPLSHDLGNTHTISVGVTL
jgi:hypothetical protein